MSDRARYLISLAAAFVGWRILVEVIPWPAAATVAVVLGVATWMLTRLAVAKR